MNFDISYRDLSNIASNIIQLLKYLCRFATHIMFNVLFFPELNNDIEVKTRQNARQNTRGSAPQTQINPYETHFRIDGDGKLESCKDIPEKKTTKIWPKLMEDFLHNSYDDKMSSLAVKINPVPLKKKEIPHSLPIQKKVHFPEPPYTVGKIGAKNQFCSNHFAIAKTPRRSHTKDNQIINTPDMLLVSTESRSSKMEINFLLN